MRIIAGKYRNRVLLSSTDPGIRPVMDRVKTFIFDVLGPRAMGSRVCDLFAGSGSLGIEAISRGAASALFVDSSEKAVDLIRRNLDKLDITTPSRVIRADAQNFIRTCSDCYDLVFCDPPYRYPHTADVVRAILSAAMMAPEGILVVEHAESLEWGSEAPPEPFRQKKFGRTVISMFRSDRRIRKS